MTRQPDRTRPAQKGSRTSPRLEAGRFADEEMGLSGVDVSQHLLERMPRHQNPSPGIADQIRGHFQRFGVAIGRGGSLVRCTRKEPLRGVHY